MLEDWYYLEEFKCSGDCQSRIEIPRSFLDREQLSSSSLLAKPEFRGENFYKYYSSEIGFIYCSRECWQNLISDLNWEI